MSDVLTSDSTVSLNDLLACGREVEPFLARFLDSRAMPDNLREAASYSLLGPGKRLRPALVLLSAEAVGGRQADAMAAAGAIEMIHCFSLIHDDLPAMDDDDLRRGRPTLHRHTSEAMAILAGDLLNTLAFELPATDRSLLERGLAGRVIAELATATTDMISGQVYDTLPEFADHISPLEQLRIIHRNKTGALIRAACRLGALCGQAAPDPKTGRTHLDALTRYGEAIGLMFQIVDDLLDVTANTKELGKTAGKDAQQGKLTYPSVLGLEESRKHVEALVVQAREAIEPLGAGGHRLGALVDGLAARRK